LVLSVIFLSFYTQKKAPASWALIVLLAPVTAPYYFFKASQKQRVIFTILFGLSFLVVGAGEFYLFSQEKARLKMAAYSPAVRQMIQLSDTLKESTTLLDHAIRKLEEKSKAISNRESLGDILTFIGEFHVIIEKNRGDVERFISFTRDYKTLLEKEGFNDILSMEEFYTNPVVITYLKSLDSYLSEFEKLVTYSFDNFESIDRKTPQQVRNYDVYYMNYRRAVDTHNRLCVKRIEFQKTIIEKHPGLELYLPTMIQTDFLKLWQ